MVEGAGPDTEFLHVVAHGSHLVGVRAGGFLEISDDLVDGAERNEVAKNLLSRNEANSLAVIFRDVVGKQLVGLEACGEKVDIVENRGAYVGFGETGRQLRLPDALGKPCAGGTLAEMVFEIVGETDELHALVRSGYRNENRLV